MEPTKSIIVNQKVIGMEEPVKNAVVEGKHIMNTLYELGNETQKNVAYEKPTKKTTTKKRIQVNLIIVVNFQTKF